MFGEFPDIKIKAQDPLVELGWPEPQLKLHWLHEHPVAKELQNTAVPQHTGNGTKQTWVEISKAHFICFFLRKLHEKKSNWIQNRERELQWV